MSLNGLFDPLWIVEGICWHWNRGNFYSSILFSPVECTWGDSTPGPIIRGDSTPGLIFRGGGGCEDSMRGDSIMLQRSHQDIISRSNYLSSRENILRVFKTLMIWHISFGHFAIVLTKCFRRASYPLSRWLEKWYYEKKWRELTPSYEKSPHRKIHSATWQHKNATKNFDYKTNADRLRTV